MGTGLRTQGPGRGARRCWASGVPSRPRHVTEWWVGCRREPCSVAVVFREQMPLGKLVAPLCPGAGHSGAGHAGAGCSGARYSGAGCSGAGCSGAGCSGAGHSGTGFLPPPQHPRVFFHFLESPKCEVVEATIGRRGQWWLVRNHSPVGRKPGHSSRPDQLWPRAQTGTGWRKGVSLGAYGRE